MPLPVRHLPVLQNWDCHGCTNCCREYHVPVSEEERQRILAQRWDQDAHLGNAALFQHQGMPWARRTTLTQRDGQCVFLNEAGRCRIHERFGAEAKPLACRIFPFVLVPVENHLRVSLRFACPSVAANQGKPLSAHSADLARFAGEIAQLAGPRTRNFDQSPPPPLQAGQHVDWPDLLRFSQAVLTLLQDRRVPIACRWRRCLGLARLCRQARFDQVQGERLDEFLQVVCTGLEAETPRASDLLPPPTWVGRVLFRQLLALFARMDLGRDQGEVARGRLALLRAAWRFTRGRGLLPRLHRLIPDTTFERLEEPRGPLPESAEAIIERYYVVKVGSMQFCGPSNFGLPFWPGLHALAVTLPVMLWWCRALSPLPPEQAAERAVGIVDYHFGFNPLLGTQRQRLSLNLLANRGELERLIGWYSR